MDTEEKRRELLNLLEDFEQQLKSDDLRKKVKALVPCFQSLYALGKSLIPRETARSARARILFYLKKYPQILIDGDELLVVSGIREYARRIRELRVQFGWLIVSGETIKRMADDDDFPLDSIDLSKVKPSDYILLSDEQDKEAAHRWNVANEIRKDNLSVKNKIIKYFRKNVGANVTGEELKYLSGDRSEWARRVRELRTEEGWPIVTQNTGRPDLEIGVYVLEADRQSPKHDRRIPDPVKRAVLQRDGYKCVECGWTNKLWDRSDPRHLELHHTKRHIEGGENTEDNLISLCTVCHDEIHRG